MKRIHVYENNPGQWCWDEANEYDYFTEITDEQFDVLIKLEESKTARDAILKSLKELEIDPL